MLLPVLPFLTVLFQSPVLPLHRPLATNGQVSEGSPLQPDSLEEGGMRGSRESRDSRDSRDSGVSTEGSHVSEALGEDELPTISVVQEVRRFQQEINKVAIANTLYHSWKKSRLVVGSLQLQALRRSTSLESSLDCDLEEAPCLPPRYAAATSQESLLQPPALPPKARAHKRVSYAPQEATVLGAEQSTGYNNRSLERGQRQLLPSTHMAPRAPPGEELDMADEDEFEEGENEQEEPVLPSVRQLASRFQVGQEDWRQDGC